jgi:hypothetical protein
MYRANNGAARINEHQSPKDGPHDADRAFAGHELAGGLVELEVAIGDVAHASRADYGR